MLEAEYDVIYRLRYYTRHNIEHTFFTILEKYYFYSVAQTTGNLSVDRVPTSKCSGVLILSYIFCTGSKPTM